MNFRHASRQPGFTMIELVVTMVVVGILAVVVMPKFSVLDEFDTYGYTEQVKSVLRYAQKSAVAQRRPIMVTYSRTVAKLCSAAYTATPACPLACTNLIDLPGGRFSPGPASITASGGVCFNAIGQAYGGTLSINVDGVGAPEITVVAETGYVY